MKKEIVSINGKPGSGKSSTADLVAKALGFNRFSSGDFMRQIAVDRGVNLNELSIQAESDPSIDISIDDQVRKAGEQSKLVIDSRMAFHFIPESFKVYLNLDPEIAKDRVLSSLKNNKLREQSEGGVDLEEIYEKITHRLESEKKRYMELYKVDHTDLSNFDLVVDTNKHNLEEVVQIIITKYKEWSQR